MCGSISQSGFSGNANLLLIKIYIVHTTSQVTKSISHCLANPYIYFIGNMFKIIHYNIISNSKVIETL